MLTDCSVGLREAVDALITLGHRHFVFLCALADGQLDGDRPQLFKILLLSRGVAGEKCEFIRCGPTVEGAYTACLEFFHRAGTPRPTAMVALNDLSAFGALRAATERGVQVPRDLSVVGVDNVPLARFLPTSLSTIGQPLEEMARKTASMLFGRIAGGEHVIREQAIFPTKFIPRESIGPAWVQ